MDDDFRPDIIAVLVAIGEDGADVLPVHVLLVYHTGFMGEDDRLALIAGKAGRVKDFFRKPELPADAPVRVRVLEDAGGRDHGMVDEVTLFRPVGFIQRDAVQPQHPLQRGLGHSDPPPPSSSSVVRASVSAIVRSWT